MGNNAGMDKESRRKRFPASAHVYILVPRRGNRSLHAFHRNQPTGAIRYGFQSLERMGGPSFTPALSSSALSAKHRLFSFRPLSNRRIKNFRRGACGTTIPVPFPGSNGPPLPADVPVWDGYRSTGEPPTLPEYSGPWMLRYPPESTRSDTVRPYALQDECCLSFPC